MTLDDLEFKIAKLDLQDGDILVVKTDSKLWGGFGSILPSGVRVLYIPTTVELSVLTREDIENLP